MEDDERPYKSKRKERESSVASSTSSRKVGPPKKRQDVQESRDTASATYQASSSNANSSGIYHQARPSRPGSVASDRNSPRPTLHRQATGNSTRTHHSGNSESRVNSPAPSHKSASIKALSRVNTGSSNSSKSSAGRASAVSSSNDSVGEGYMAVLKADIPRYGWEPPLMFVIDVRDKRNQSLHRDELERQDLHYWLCNGLAAGTGGDLDTHLTNHGVDLVLVKFRIPRGSYAVSDYWNLEFVMEILRQLVGHFHIGFALPEGGDSEMSPEHLPGIRERFKVEMRKYGLNVEYVVDTQNIFGQGPNLLYVHSTILEEELRGDR